ncbi:MAG: discoidin domain-containing protein, partial [Phycisphaerales bacterium]
MHRRIIHLVLAMGLCFGPVAHAANIILVNETYDTDANGSQDDLGLEEFLVGLGHQVNIQRGNWTTLDAAKIATLNAADLIVVSRSTGSGNYDDDATEISNWNGLTAPMILLTPYLSRGTSSGYRWYWFNSTAITNLTGPLMQVVVPTHPIFKGVPLDASSLVDVVDGTTGTGQTSFAGTIDVGSGTLLARTATGTNSWIVEWQPGSPYYTGSPGTPGGKRMLFCAGTQESGATPQGAFNLTENGKKLFTNAINYMAGIEEIKTATDPAPANEATDVVRDIVLGWTPNAWAATHDVYFGTDADAVANADATQPMGVLVSQGQDASSYDPDGILEFGQTYYWRIDEVNGAPDFTVFKGEVWSFTTEPVSYPIQSVIATASSATPSMGPEKTVDGSGLNAEGQHSTEPTEMWLSAKDAPEPAWIQFEFDSVYKLDGMRVWNYNQALESLLGFGINDVTIEYSVDGATWTASGDFVFAQAPGDPTYTGEIIDLSGIVARTVRLTIHSNWGGIAEQFGLSEVRFLHIPTRAREPQPGSGATGVSVDTLLSWRAGREAVSHQVYFGTDQQAVADGTAPAATLTDDSFDPGSLLVGTTYYCRVDEVNEAAVPSVWEGEVWSFTTSEFLVVDDLEGYTDDEGNRIYESWIDGMTNELSGS